MNDRNGVSGHTDNTVDGVTAGLLQGCNMKVFAIKKTFKIQWFPKASSKQNNYTLITTICLTPVMQRLLQACSSSIHLPSSQFNVIIPFF